MSFLPSPQSIEFKTGKIPISMLKLPQICPFEQSVMYELWGESGGREPANARYEIQFRVHSSYQPEEYQVEVCEDAVVISFSDTRGAFYGFVTLCELVKSQGEQVSCLEIRDKPYMRFRAVSDDISRGQISTLDHFKSIIRRLSQFKYNVYMPYIEDVFRFESEPGIGQFSDPVSPAEWKELISYAKRYFVEIRPIFNTLGHWDKIGVLEQYHDLMLTSENSTWPAVCTLDLHNPAVQPLLSKLLGEIVDVFGKGLIHVGGDEPIHLTEVYGVEHAAELYSEHYLYLHDELEQLGCTMAMYADMFAPVWGDYGVGQKAARQLPRDIKMVYWCYDPAMDYSGISQLQEAGFSVITSPSTATCRVLLPAGSHSYNNANKLRSSAGQSEGIIMSNWTDAGLDIPRELAWLGYAIGAEFGWAQSPVPYETLVGLFHQQFLGLDREVETASLLPSYDIPTLFGIPGMRNLRRAWRIFWQDPRDPVDRQLKSYAPAVLRSVRTVQNYLNTIIPKRNLEYFACLCFGLRRLGFLAEKLTALEIGRYQTLEQARSAVPAIKALAVQTRELLSEANKRWYSTNRESQWSYLEARYLDLAEAFESLARYSANTIQFQSERKYLLSEVGIDEFVPPGADGKK